MYFIKCRMRSINVLILLTLWPQHNATKLEVKFCGFEQRCSRNMTMQWSEWKFCCRPCECDDICIEKETCCRDKKKVVNMESHVNIQQKCLTSAYKPNGTDIHINFVSYFTRTSCPKEYNNTDIKAKCASVGPPKTITEIRPVSSVDGNIVYKNKYCGYCHGERRTLDWEVSVHKASYLSCRKVLSTALDIDTIYSKILSNCILHFIPPTNIEFWKVMCFEESNIKKQCNMTGTMETIDNELNDFCLNQTDAGYFILDETGNVYPNLFCYQCNSNYEIPYISQCLNRIERQPYSASLYVLLNLNKLLDQDNSKQKSRPCGKGEIFDTFFNKCRALHCVRGFIPFKGKCVPFLANDEVYELVIKLTPTQNIKETELTQNDLKNHYTHIKKILGFGKCSLCDVNIFVKENITVMILQEMYIVLSFTPTSRCRIENIFSNLMSLEAKLPLILNLPVNNELFDFAVSRANTSKAILNNQLKKFLRVEILKACPSFSTDHGRICPKVKLLKNDVKHVMTFHPRREELLWIEGVNGSAFVCCDKYLSYQTSLSSSNVYACLPITFIVIVWFRDRFFVEETAFQMFTDI